MGSKEYRRKVQYQSTHTIPSLGAVFTEVSKNNWFLHCYPFDWLSKTLRFFIQSQEKPKTLAPSSGTFSRASSHVHLHVFTLSLGWFTVCVPCDWLWLVHWFWMYLPITTATMIATLQETSKALLNFSTPHISFGSGSLEYKERKTV